MTALTAAQTTPSRSPVEVPDRRVRHLPFFSPPETLASILKGFRHAIVLDCRAEVTGTVSRRVP